MVSSGAFPLGSEIAFAVGVKDSEPNRAERFTELVVSTRRTPPTRPRRRYAWEPT